MNRISESVNKSMNSSKSACNQILVENYFRGSLEIRKYHEKIKSTNISFKHTVTVHRADDGPFIFLSEEPCTMNIQ